MRRAALSGLLSVVAISLALASLDAERGRSGSAQQSAVEPLVVLNASQQFTSSPGVANGQFGAAMAIDGDVAVVGAATTSGPDSAVYVFRRIDGTWTQEARLTVDDAGMMSAFGSSAAISGDTVVVGAHRANEWTGLAYVFVRGVSGWYQQARLEAAAGTMGDHFGESVAVDGDRVAIGAPEVKVGEEWGQGVVYVYGRTSNVWTLRATLTPGDGASEDKFGKSVALQGTYLVGGAPGDDVSGVNAAGSARVFHLVGTSWGEQGVLAAPDGAAFDALGSSVAIDDDTVVAGAPGTTVDGLASAGAAHVFDRSGTTWAHEQRLVSPEPAQNDEFGRTLAVSGDTVIVGVPADTVGVNAGQGSVFAFIRNDGAWSGFRTLQVADGAAYDFLGTGVAIEEGTVLVGAPGRQVNGNSMQGAGYAFDLPPALFWIQPVLGSTAGGTVVGVGGLHFAPGAALTIGGLVAADTTVWSPELITGTTAAHAAGPADVVVMNPGGESSALAGGFTYSTPPSVNYVVPTHGPASGGTVVTIHGASFQTGPTVTFGGQPGTAVTRIGSGSLTARTPVHAAGDAAVVVTNPDGLQSNADITFAYDPPPTVTGVSPESGPTGGGASVTIDGTGFVSGAGVKFGGTPAPSVTFSSSTRLFADTPAHAAGTVDVVVQNPDGQSGTLASAFLFTNTVTIESVSPASVAAGSSTTVTIQGTGFTEDHNVLLDRVYADTTYVDPTRLTAEVLPRGAGVVDVEVALPGYVDAVVRSNAFTYVPVPGGERRQLTRHEHRTYDAFGASLASAGSRLFVGDTGGGGEGRVDVFAWNGNTWGFDATLTPDESVYDYGAAVAADGSTVVVGAPYDDVFVFEHTDTWHQAAHFEVGSNDWTRRFGQAVAISGDWLVVGAPRISSDYDAGSAEVYWRSPTGWQHYATLHDPWQSEYTFGSAVAISGSTMMITSSSFQHVSVYELMDGTWGYQQSLSLGGESSSDFGRALALSGDTAIIGAPFADNGLGHSGAALVFGRTDAGWVQQAKLVTADPELVGDFGSGVALLDGRVAVSAESRSGPVVYTFEQVTSAADPAWEEVGPYVRSLAVPSSAPPRPASPVALVSDTVVIATRKCWLLSDVDNTGRGCVDAFLPGPAIRDISPATGTTAGGTTVRISGRALPAGGAVSFGGAAASETVVLDPHTILAVTPPHAAGAVNVTMTNPPGSALSVPGGFTFTAPPAVPVITDITPSLGTAGQEVTITGTGFTGSCTVRFGYRWVGSWDVDIEGTTVIRAVAPDNGWGPVDVTVVNGEGGAATATSGFTYEVPAGAPGVLMNAPGVTEFGAYLDVEGDLAVASSLSPGYAFSGTVYILRRAYGRWRIETALDLGVDVATDGSAVAADGVFLTSIHERLLGQWNNVSTIRTNQGSPLALGMDAGVLVMGRSDHRQVSVFNRGASGWTRGQILAASGVSDDNFGQAVAIDEAWLGVGTDTAVITFQKIAGEWVQRTVLESPLTNGAVFGSVVALDGTTVAVGVPGDNPSGAANRGSVFLFAYDGNTWNPAGQLIAPDGVAGDQFGAKVSLNGSWLAVQAPGVNAAGDRVGAVYLYERRNNAWQLNGKLRPWAAGESFTLDLAVADHELLVGTTSGLAVYPLPPVVVIGVLPSIGPTAGGAVVTILGQHFEAGSTVTIGGVAATNVTVVGPLVLTARTPAHAAGAADVVVRHPNGLSGTMVGGYTYRNVDLIISAIAAPAALGPGESRTVSVTTKNTGPGTVPTSTTALYLSGDTVVDAADVLLNTHAVPVLDANRTSRTEVTIEVPAGTAAGSYYLIAVADANGGVGERTETNNTKTKTLRVGCDLVVSAIAAPQNGKQGVPVTISATTKNNGPGRAPATTTRVRLSLDNVYSSDDAVLSTISVGALNAGVTRKGTFTWTVPAGLALGRYYIVAKADVSGDAPETNEANNTKAKPFTVR